MSSFQALGSVDEFLEKLPSFDAEIEAQRKDAEASGEVSFCLLYLPTNAPILWGTDFLTMAFGINII